MVLPLFGKVRAHRGIRETGNARESGIPAHSIPVRGSASPLRAAPLRQHCATGPLDRHDEILCGCERNRNYRVLIES
ncbi:hypothetical protein HMPREF0762_01665 [Slackia exigua ATCC 700122]|uniref:Uncharacterized protein n=1 Tax=Slackia exigua (strain ATCC 700122 / DSM 15923 / CIP 105133 / JCM 11022 / KCTC 5966 / S-7) TaxID=649764 RepID=D0WIJ1_SLAES|nr:hypothetical protein HMPREF0762_01665 [Slackia exigua ATCC 700122]